VDAEAVAAVVVGPVEFEPSSGVGVEWCDELEAFGRVAVGMREGGDVDAEQKVERLDLLFDRALGVVGAAEWAERGCARAADPADIGPAQPFAVEHGP